jgi:hypothetical protein
VLKRPQHNYFYLVWSFQTSPNSSATFLAWFFGLRGVSATNVLFRVAQSLPALS